MLDRTRLSRLITLALASCAVTWAFAAGACARPDATIATATPAPVYKAVPGDTDKAPSAARPPAFKAVVVDTNKAPARPALNRNLAASLGQSSGKAPRVVVARTDDNSGTIALITAIAAMLVALAAATFIVTRPQRPVLHG